MTLLEQAKRFREIFGQDILGNISRFGFVNKQLWDMQTNLIEEEAAEFLEAADECFADPEDSRRREELTKELSDLVFVCYQFAAAFGIDLDKAMDLVYESNLSKLDEQGKPIFRPDGKVLKGPNYRPPDLGSCTPQTHFYYDTHGK